MAPDVVAEIIADDLVWDITPGAPFGGVYHGWDSASNDFFGRSMMHMLKGFPFFKTIFVALMMLKIELFTSCYLISSEKADQGWFDSLPNSWKRR